MGDKKSQGESRNNFSNIEHYSSGAVQHGTKNTISQSQTSEWGDQMARQCLK